MADDQTPAESGETDQTPRDTSSDTPSDAPVPTVNESGTDVSSDSDAGSGVDDAGAPVRTAAPRKKAAARKRPAKKTAASEQPAASADAVAPTEPGAEGGASDGTPADEPAVKKSTRKRTTKKAAAAPPAATASDAPAETPSPVDPEAGGAPGDGATDDGRPTPPTVLFQPPPATPAPRRRKAASSAAGAGGAESSADTTSASSEGAGDVNDVNEANEANEVQRSSTSGQAQRKSASTRSGQGKARPQAQRTPPDGSAEAGDEQTAQQADEGTTEDDAAQDSQDEAGSDDGTPRRRRRRGGRRRRGKGGQDDDDGSSDESDESDDTNAAEGDTDSDSEGDGQSQSTSSRRRRRRRRSGENGDDTTDESEGSGTKVRSARAAEDEITSFTGSTRLEAKKQRRREGREAGRRRAPVISEAEFLARREAVTRKMVVRQRDDLTQIAVMEDKVLVEHYVARESQTSLIGNVYLGRVQNVLPSMEAAFIDIGRGRNAVLYAGEVNWDSLGAGGGGKERKIEQVLKPGQPVLVQVTKDPIGHKGARLTSQISLPGRFLVYVPEGNTSGISRKLPDTERNRLKTLLKEIVPSEAGVIVRTAAEGAAEEELRRDVARLTARWEDIKGKVEGGNAPEELYSEPDLTLKVVRDLFTEDIGELVVSGADAWDMVAVYVDQVAPDLAERLTKHDDSELDAFAAYRIDEQIAKALERKVWLPSGGSLIIDRTEAMTVVDVNTGKFTGSGGNLEETVTKNNLEAAEEIVRQLRLRDIGGIIVIDFIDMVLEGNRELVLRRLIECLGRDRTRHQVAEVTSLGLVQMTRKRIGTGLLEAFSEQCEHCQGRGYHVHPEPVEHKKKSQEDDSKRGRRSRRGKSDDQDSGRGGNDRDAGQGKNDRNGRNGSRVGSDDSTNGDDHGDGVRRPTPAEFAAMANRPPDSSGDDGHTPDGDLSAPSTAATVASDDVQSEQPEQPTRPETPEQATAEPAEPGAPSEPSQPVEPVALTEPRRTAVPEGPRIVTSTRRRGATRAAGPPRSDPPQSPT